MFNLSKRLAAFTPPLTWGGGLLLCLAWWWLPRRPRAERAMLAVALTLGVLVGWQPLPDAWVRALEYRHAPRRPAACWPMPAWWCCAGRGARR